MSMVINERGTLLSAKTNEFTNDKGEIIKYSRLRFMVDGEIYPVKCAEDDVKMLESKISETGNLVLELTSYKESIKLEYVSFEI